VSIPALQNLPQIVAAISGLGTAAFGLVDASKVLGGGPNRIGFGGIRTAVTALTPAQQAPAGPSNSLTQQKILDTLMANWFNGVDLGGQKSIAKSLIKLNLRPSNATALAQATGVNGAILTSVAGKISTGATLDQAESDLYARFDMILTALLDEAYQRGDHDFRNGTRALAMVVAVILAVTAGIVVHTGNAWTTDMVECFLVGLLATPVAPIAKDLSTALATAVNTMQLVKK